MNNKKTKILILQRILPHYRAGIFKKIEAAFPLTKVLYGNPASSESLKNTVEAGDKLFSEKKNFYFGRSGKVFLSGIYSEIFKYKPDVIISVFNVGNLNIYFLFLLKFFLKFKLILWSFGYDPERGFNPEKSFTDKIRLFLSQHADAVIYYWNKGREEVAAYSKKTEHYFTAPNTLDTDRLTELKNDFDKEGKSAIKSNLGVKDNFHFIYTGRLLKDKEVDLLLRAFAMIESKYDNAGLTIIGGGPEFENLLNFSKELNLKKVEFKGEILDEEITGKWIYISDAFLMPGRLGLSVVHSFCFGTPVISQMKDSYFHGEGIGYLKNEVNGLLSEDGDILSYADKIEMIIQNPELSGEMRENALKTIDEECSVQKMVAGFSEAVGFVLK